MPISPEQVDQIREWGRGIYDHILNEPPDTTPERIKANREKLLPYYQEMKDSISKIPEQLPPLARPKLDEVLELFDDYFNYFSSGYRAKTNIDDFPDKLKQAFSKMVKFKGD